MLKPYFGCMLLIYYSYIKSINRHKHKRYEHADPCLAIKTAAMRFYIYIGHFQPLTTRDIFGCLIKLMTVYMQNTHNNRTET